MRAAEDFCPACGANAAAERLISSQAQHALSRARVWILVVGIAYAVSGLLVLSVQGRQMSPHAHDVFLAMIAALCATHVGLWVWARWQPLAASITAFLLFAGVQLVQVVEDPSSIYKGVIVKIGFTLAIIRAIRAGIVVQRARGAAR